MPCLVYQVVKGPATRTSEGSVFEESGDSDADGNECCSSNDIHNNSWQGEPPANSFSLDCFDVQAGCCSRGA